MLILVFVEANSAAVSRAIGHLYDFEPSSHPGPSTIDLDFFHRTICARKFESLITFWHTSHSVVGAYDFLFGLFYIAKGSFTHIYAQFCLHTKKIQINTK